MAGFSIIEDAVAKLENDDFVILYIPKDDTPYHIQMSTFRSVLLPDSISMKSAEHFKKGPRYNFKIGASQAWKVLLYWTVSRKSLPSMDPVLLAQCWQLGRDFNIPEFQDAAMIVLLQHFEDTSSRMTPQLLSVEDSNFQNPSELSELFLEELVKSLCYHDIDPGDVGLSKPDNLSAIFPGLLQTQKRFMKDKDSFFNRFTKREGEETARWEDLMAADGLKTIWHRDAKGKSLLGKRKRDEES